MSCSVTIGRLAQCRFERVLNRLLVLAFWALATFASPASALAPTSAPYPVIFIHGLASSAQGAWGPAVKWLDAAGWIGGGDLQVVPGAGVTGLTNASADYFFMNMSDWQRLPSPSQSLTLQQQGLEVAAIVRRVRAATGATKVVLVGHSMGGLAARAYVQSLGTNRYAGDVARLVTVGTPHLGSELATILRDVVLEYPILVGFFDGLRFDFGSVAVNDLRPGSTSLTRLNTLNGATAPPNDIAYTLIAGSGDIGQMPGPGDGIVSFESQLYLPGNPSHVTRRGIYIEHPAPASGRESLPCHRLMDTRDGFNYVIAAQVHTCETSDANVWAEVWRALNAPSVEWQTPPPATMTSGQAYTVTWRNRGGSSVTHSNVHWDPVDPTDASRCSAATTPPCSTVNLARGLAPATMSATLTAPLVSVPTTYYFVAHTVTGGTAAWSSRTRVTVQPGAASALSVSPQALDFGSVTVGGFADRTLTLTNVGTGPLTGVATTSGRFSVVAGASYSIAAGASAPVTVRYTPLAAGSDVATVELTGGGDASRVVSGAGVTTAAFNYSGAPIDFGATIIGSYRDAALTVFNTGGTALNVTASVSAPFSIVSSQAFALAAGASSVVVVRFTPSSTGSTTRSVTLSSAAGVFSPSVTGSGEPAPVIARPPAVVTGTPFNLRANEALLYGTVNPNDLTASAWFEWGATTSYGNVTAPESQGGGANTLGYTKLITGLAPGATYHYRAVAQNAVGTTLGLDQTFVTPSAPPAALCVGPTSMDFVVSQGGPPTSTRSLQIRNCGGGTMAFAIATDQPWLTASPGGGSSAADPVQATVTATTAGMAAGAYYANVTVTAAGVAGSPVRIPVAVIVGQSGVGALAWQPRAPAPEAGRAAASAVFGGRLFFFGVRGSPRSYAYDLGANTWTPIAEAAGGMGDGGAAVVGSRIYVVTGDWGVGTTRLRIYDTTSDTWAVSDVPGPLRQGAAVAAVDGQVFVIGGSDLSLRSPLADVLAFNPTTAAWTPKAGVMPTARGYAAVAVWNGQIFVSGGLDNSPGAFNSTRLEAYDPVADTWAVRAGAPTARKLASGAVLGDRLLVLGGLSGCASCGADNTFASVDEYDPVIDVWKTVGSLTASRRAQAAVGVVGTQIVVAGGINIEQFTTDLASTEAGVLNGESNPGAPATPQVTLASPSAATLTWSLVGSAASGFRIERLAPGSGGFEDVAILGASARSYADNGLSPNTAYTYRISAFNAGGASSYSAPVTVTTPVVPPDAPRGVSAVAGSSSAVVSFSTPINTGGAPVIRFDVVVSPGGSTVSGTASPIQVSGLVNGARYSFRVRAANAAGSGTFSTPSNEVVPSAGTPTAVADSYATAFGVTLTVAAPGVLGNDSSNDGGGLSAVLVSPPTGGVVTLAADGAFSYTPNGGFTGRDVFTYRATSTSGGGATATVSIDVAASGQPLPPTGLRVAAITGSLVTFEWVPPAGGPAPTGYQIEGGLAPGQVLGILPLGSAPSLTLSMPSGIFHVRIRTVAGGAVSAASADVVAHVNTPAPPSAPANLQATVSGNAVELRWVNTFGGGPPTGVALGVSGSASVVVPLGLVDGYSVAGVPSGTYTLSLTATNAAGASGPSNATTITVPVGCSGPPLAVTNVVVYTVGRTAHVRWDPAATGPAAARYVLNVTGAFSGDIPSSVRMVAGAVAPGTYVIRVAGINACGTGLFSGAQSLVVP